MRLYPSTSKTDIRIAVIFIGLPKSGKTAFFHRYFSEAYSHIELSSLERRGNERAAISDCILHGDSYVIDNENASREDRRRYFEKARDAGYRVIGYYFENDLDTALERSGKKSDRSVRRHYTRISSRLEIPDYAEGFDELYKVDLMRNGEYSVTPMKDAR